MKPKYLLGGALVFMAIAIVIIQGFASGDQYFLTVGQLRSKGPEIVNQSVRISGTVIGDTIQVDAQNLRLEFQIVESVDPIGSQQPLLIRYEGPRPELLQDHAQAIVEGHLNGDGTFAADSLLLKCPTRYEEQFPNQVTGN